MNNYKQAVQISNHRGGRTPVCIFHVMIIQMELEVWRKRPSVVEDAQVKIGWYKVR
jgi:hypothetical protein